MDEHQAHTALRELARTYDTLVLAMHDVRVALKHTRRVTDEPAATLNADDLITLYHELFWALIFLQAIGLHPLSGLLAIAIPYAGIFAKVYAEILGEANSGSARSAPQGSGHVSTFFYARLPDAWVHIKTYTLYRLECGLRSSAILGLIGLPTLGFHLQSAFCRDAIPRFPRS